MVPDTRTVNWTRKERCYFSRAIFALLQTPLIPEIRDVIKSRRGIPLCIGLISGAVEIKTPTWSGDPTRHKEHILSGSTRQSESIGTANVFREQIRIPAPGAL